MSVEHVLNSAKRAREAHYRVVQAAESRGEQTLAQQAEDAIEKAQVKALANSQEVPFLEIVEKFGGAKIAREDLTSYGIDPAVIYMLNEEEGFDMPGDFFGFPDGSLTLLS